MPRTFRKSRCFSLHTTVSIAAVERLVRKAEANYRITAELDYLLLTWLATNFIIDDETA